MSTLTITAFGDTWVNSARADQNYGDTGVVRVVSGDRYGLLLPSLPALAGRLVLDAYLVGHAGADGLDAQTITWRPITERWQPGRVTWNRKPAVNGSAGGSVAISATDPDGAFTITGLDSALQAVADGGDWYGIRLTTSATSSQSFRSADSGKPAWELVIELSDVPDAPTGLRPDGGGNVDVDADVVVGWDAVDDQASSWVQLDTPASGEDPDDVAPDYDSGWQTNVDPQWPLSAYWTPAAGPNFWRVNVEDADGNQTGWSDWAEFGVSTMPTLVVDSPTGAFGDPSPVLAAHLDSGTVKSWKAMATGPSRADVRAETGVQDGSISWQVPLKTKRGQRVFTSAEGGWLYVKVWPEGDWATAIGAPPYREEWIPVELTASGTVTAPTNLSVVQYEAGDPRLQWQWFRTEAADAWLITVDGVEVARLEPEDVEVDGGVYSWTDSGEVQPLRPHTLGVVAVEGVETSEPVTLEHSHTVHGFWLLPDDGSDPVVLDGTAVEGFAQTDSVATYTTLEGREVDIVYGRPGFVGTFEGQVWDNGKQDVWAALDAVEELRRSHTRAARVVWGSRTMMARIRSPHSTPSGEILPNNLLHAVRLGVVQTGP